MRAYEIKGYFPGWHFDPATTRQLKVLCFFGFPVDPLPTKGRASSAIRRLFSDPANKRLWQAYVYVTGDEDDESSELRPHDRAALTEVVIPNDWRPKGLKVAKNGGSEALEHLVADLLKQGSPFDDPLPEISIAGTVFCFTGLFEFGTRTQCQEAVASRGGILTDGVTSKTNVLVIGSDANPAWSHGSYGNKIQKAMIHRMQRGRPFIIPEAFWKFLLAE